MSERAVAQLTEAILERDQPRTTDLFFQMVKRDGRSLGDALGVVTAAEAPFVQVPSHINVRDGQITLINNDHTVLGLRTGVSLAPFLPESHRLLPLLQAVWYIPAGLDIWNQLLGRYPGRYATMKGMNVPPPSYGPVVWNQEEKPITEAGTPEERLHAHMIATMSGDVRRSYGLFLGLAADEQTRPLLRNHMLFLGLIDLQDTVAGRKARNTGHKALRARAITDLADVVGWDRAQGVYYIGVPDMAVGPLYYSIYDAACVTVTGEFADAGKTLGRTNQTPLTPDEVDEMVRLLMEADGETVWNQVTAHLKNGRSIRSLGDALQIGAAELILRTTVPRQFTDGQHPFDYCNVANYWFRTSDSPYQARVLYLMANFINDVARSNKLTTSVIERDCASFDASGRTPHALLEELDEEAKTTRRVLERVPDDSLDWRPHPTARTLGKLALHVAVVPGALAEFVTTAPVVPAPDFSNVDPGPRAAAELLPALQQSVDRAKELLGRLDDAALKATWRIVQGDREVLAVPRVQFVRSAVLNHWYHHRGQLTVYLRMLGVPVPALYGASRDENLLA